MLDERGVQGLVLMPLNDKLDDLCREILEIFFRTGISRDQGV